MGFLESVAGYCLVNQQYLFESKYFNVI